MALRKPSPLISSVNALRGVTAGITLLSLAGMAVYAGGHLHNTTAPLQPAAAATAAPAAAATRTTTTGRLQLSKTVPTTSSSRTVTTTHHS